MPLQFTADGVEIETFDEIYNRVADGLKNIYGADINLAQESPDGQRVGIIVKEIQDGQSFGQLLYSQLDVDFSFGTFQDVIAKIAGVFRRPASLSQADINLISDRILTLEAGYTIEDDNGQKWLTDSDNSIVAGSNTITVFAEQFGAISAAANTINTPVSIVLGVTSVTNPLDAVVGVDEESDPELRVKRNESVENPAYSTLGSIVAKVYGLSGVTDVDYYENDTDVFDATLSLNGHHIWLIIEGGEIADIAEVFAKNKTGGTGTKGSTTGTFTETITKADGSTFTITHSYKFDRPTETPLYVQLDAKRRDPAQPIDTALIAQKIAERKFTISEDADASSLYADAYQAGTNFILSSLEVSDDNVTFTDMSIDATAGNKFTLDVSNITVTEI